METDASDYITTGILLQKGSDHILRLVAFFLQKYSPAKYNYKIYNKELLAIIRAFKEWRLELEGFGMPI